MEVKKKIFYIIYLKCFEAALAVCIWRLHDVMSIKIRLTKINVIKAMPRAPGNHVLLLFSWGQ
jgi:hypothetical protein